MEKEFLNWCRNGTGTFYVKGREIQPRHRWNKSYSSGEPECYWYDYAVAAQHNIKISNPYVFTVPAKDDNVQPMRLPVSELPEEALLMLLKREMTKFKTAYQDFVASPKHNYKNPNGLWGFRGVSGLATALTEIGYVPADNVLLDLVNLIGESEAIETAKLHLPPELVNDCAQLFDGITKIAKLGEYEKYYSNTNELQVQDQVISNLQKQ